MKLSVNTIHVIQMNLCGLVAILIGILGLFTICSCFTKVIINQNELPDECYKSSVKNDSSMCLNKIPNVFKIELDSILEIDPKMDLKLLKLV